eukprot:8342744-Pyramimonas_sp.AAC.1
MEETLTPSPERMRWNQDDLMQCLRRGHRRVEFLENVEARLQETEDTWRAMLTDGRPGDFLFHLDDVL